MRHAVRLLGPLSSRAQTFAPIQPMQAAPSTGMADGRSTLNATCPLMALCALVCVCICACVHACSRVCMHVCVLACVLLCVYACVRACTFALVCVCMCACVLLCVYACVRACTRALMWSVAYIVTGSFGTDMRALVCVYAPAPGPLSSTASWASAWPLHTPQYACAALFKSQLGQCMAPSHSCMPGPLYKSLLDKVYWQSRCCCPFGCQAWLTGVALLSAPCCNPLRPRRSSPAGPRLLASIPLRAKLGLKVLHCPSAPCCNPRCLHLCAFAAHREPVGPVDGRVPHLPCPARQPSARGGRP